MERNESLAYGLKRIVGEQLDGASEGLSAASATDPDAAVHDARKRMKKSRAVLRLTREALGSSLYRGENARLREAGRALSDAREAHVLVETLERVAERSNGAVSPEAVARLRLRLEADRDAVHDRLLGRGNAVEEAIEALRAVRDGVREWPLEGDDFGLIARGLRRTYARGGARMAEATERPTVWRMHEWRRRAKDLWYHARILEPVWPEPMAHLVVGADELGELLGEDHDLALLHRRAGDHADALASRADTEALLALLQGRRVELRRRAFSLGRRLYADRPEAFVARTEGWWAAWREEANETAPSQAGLQPPTPEDDGLHDIDLGVEPHEASDLLPIDSPAVLGAHGWDLGFWAVLDDAPVETSLVALGHHAEAISVGEGWESRRMPCRAPGAKGKTDDGEALARHEGWVYVFGSQYGGKAGPLQPKRAWIARFREDRIETPIGSGKVELEVSRNRFRLHRAVNDALRESGPELFGIDPSVQEDFVQGAREQGEKKGKSWADRVRDGDLPLNVEGAAFRPNGRLLLGLRLPTTAGGDPILVEIASVEPLFASEEDLPEVTGFWVLEGLGDPKAPDGVRALRDHGHELHVVTGSLERMGKDSSVLREHPEGRHSHSTHSRFRLPQTRGRRPRVGRVKPTLVRHFADTRKIEGVAADRHGRFYYVSDEDQAVPLRFAEATATEVAPV